MFRGKAKSQTTEASFRERIDNIVKERSVKTKDVSPQHVDNEDTLLLPFAKQAPPRHLLQVPSYMRMINASKKGKELQVNYVQSLFHRFCKHLCFKLVCLLGCMVFLFKGSGHYW